VRIVFIGAVAFSRRCLEATLDAGGDVVAVLTLARERAGFHADYADVGAPARAAGIPVHLVENVNRPETLALIRSLRPDVIFVFGWSQLLGDELLASAPCIGSHPALLPRDRGRHPITWALVDGLDESGLTFLWLDAGADTGDILWQRAFSISPDDDAADVYERIEELAVEAIHEFVPQLAAGTAPRVPQDHTLATVRRKRTDDDRWIDWTRPSVEIHNLVRGLARPYVGALARVHGQDVVVWRTRLLQPGAVPDGAAGTVVSSDPPVVRTGDGAVALLELEPTDVLAVGDRFDAP
jgi:methionyl-tRNA formyltransferase